VHRETGERPVDRLERERPELHRVPAEPYTLAFGVTRSVSWSSLVAFEGARYSVPHRLAGTTVLARRAGEEIVIVAVDRDGPKEVARHRAATSGQVVVVDEHYPPRRATPERVPRATNEGEAAFLALGEGARRYLIEMAATGTRGIAERMAEASMVASAIGADRVDHALGIAAIAGRFEPGDLTSILATAGTTVHQVGEEHSLQQGTSAWEGFGR
jgi:hypothetical protein